MVHKKTLVISHTENVRNLEIVCVAIENRVCSTKTVCICNTSFYLLSSKYHARRYILTKSSYIKVNERTHQKLFINTSFLSTQKCKLFSKLLRSARTRLNFHSLKRFIFFSLKPSHAKISYKSMHSLGASKDDLCCRVHMNPRP